MTIFCPIKIDLSGNTVWPQASGFSKIRQNALFLAFLMNVCPLKKCKRSSLRSQCCMRLFLWFSNTVKFVKYTAFPAFVKTFSSPFFVLLLWRKPSAFNFRLGSKIKWVKEGYQPTPSLKVHLQTFACKNYREVRLLKKEWIALFLSH